MPVGGKRPGAGRPKGSRNRRTLARQQLADTAASAGITPLEVMLEAMRAHHASGRLDQAAAIAKDAAPYLHPKLSAIEHTGPQGGPVQFVIEAPPKAGSAEEWASRHKP